MRKTVWLLAAVLFFPSEHSFLKAQEQAPTPTLKAKYDPDDPNADANGFVWPQISNPKSKIQNPKSRIQDPKSQIQDPKSENSNPGPGIQDPKSKIHSRENRALASETEAPTSPGPDQAAAARGTRPNYLEKYYRHSENPPAGAVTEKKGSLGGIIMQLMGGLGLVLGLMILGSAGLKKLSLKGKWMGRRGQLWQVIETTPLGPKRTLYVTRFVDRVILLGGTDQQMNVLAEIQDPSLATAIESGDADFRRFLVPETLQAARPLSPEEKEDEPEQVFEDEPVAAGKTPIPSPEPPAPALRSTFSSRV